ncbi:hypothetical protein [Thermogymnomonas acidicola]|uniref:hypothetical protein n=1 Tax=Thermogymnomonas acidicola TaxID=399579 RepID=UPI0009463F85|nr:hypothetical protein [Thermogymnomonas acidicola]
MAAMAAGLEREALEHLRLLFSHSDRGGRIPHEIPITGDGDPSFEIGKKKIGTMYMSVDSSPLWVLAYARYVFWTGGEHPMGGEELLEVSRFLASLDSDSDGLIENRFSEGLIGWPESWADRRDGKCVDANAWYTEARRLLWGGMGVSGEVDMRKVRDTFWDGSVFLDSIGEGKRRILSSSTVVPCMYMECEECRRFLDFMAGGEHMLTPWGGMRSMSTTDPMYDGGYHTGTVWPPLMSGWLSLALFRNGMRDRGGLEALKTFVDAAFSSDDPGRINETYSASEFVPTGQFAQAGPHRSSCSR